MAIIAKGPFLLLTVLVPNSPATTVDRVHYKNIGRIHPSGTGSLIFPRGITPVSPAGSSVPVAENPDDICAAVDILITKYGEV